MVALRDIPRWYGFVPREMSGLYYRRGIADFTSLEVRLDGMVQFLERRMDGMVWIPREVSDSYYTRGIADFTSLEVKLDGKVQFLG